MYRIWLRSLLCWVALSLFCSASAGAASPSNASDATTGAIYLPTVARAPITIADLAVSAPNLYIATGATLTIGDVAQPAQARSLAALTLPQPISALAAAAPYVYVLTAPPSSAGQVTLPARPQALRVDNGRAYIADVNGNVLIADVTTPEQPVVLGSFTP